VLRAFTLIELLVVVAVIGILVAILLPALKAARNSGRDAVCLSNHRQFGVAAGLYFSDYDNFPVPEDYSWYELFACWGGVDWFGENFQVSLAERPLNQYVAPHKQIKARAEVFMCPRDDSMRNTNSDNRIIWERVMGQHSWAHEDGTTVYSSLGNSYAANDWMFCRPGSRQGWGHGDWPSPMLRTDLGPDDVRVAPNRFILFSDWGSFWAGRYDQEGREDRDLIYGWWHGYEIGQMTFLDGSARRHEMGDVTTQDYTFYVDPHSQPPGSWKTVYQP
jgi:prepilin-type N-terminal cleavage/methylation domain-containing protein